MKRVAQLVAEHGIHSTSYTSGETKLFKNYLFSSVGNQTERSSTSTGTEQSRIYDAENRLVEVVSNDSLNSTTSTSDYIYDGNGKRLVQMVTQSDGKTTTTKRTLYIGNLYEEDITTPTSQNPPYVVYYFLAEKMVGLFSCPIIS